MRRTTFFNVASLLTSMTRTMTSASNHTCRGGASMSTSIASMSTSIASDKEAQEAEAMLDTGGTHLNSTQEAEAILYHVSQSGCSV